MHTELLGDRDRWFCELEHAACLDDAALAACLHRLRSKPTISIPILTGHILNRLTQAAGELPFRPARSEVGKPEARVYQEFGYCGDVPDDHPLSHLGRWLEARLERALALLPHPPVRGGFTINDVVCQRYRPGDLGITPHRDHAAYTDLVVLVVLSGRGRYFVCADRQGRHKDEISSEPGRAILMPGPGFAGSPRRPFHMVSDIASLRYSAGFRHDSRKSGGCDTAP
jgi:hypothetical protein